MHFVITNDDGIDAPGLAVLHRAVARLGSVSVVAPVREQSGGGHTVTVRGPIAISEMNHPAFGRAFAVQGSPADCVRLAVVELLDEPVDWVVSGVNLGANLGVDTFYSGTVAAAREAAFLGMRSAAVSQLVWNLDDGGLDWGVTEALAGGILEQLAAAEPPGGILWNVNLPWLEPGQAPTGVRVVPPGFDPLGVRFRRTGDGADRQYVYATAYRDRTARKDADVGAVFTGGIAVSPISYRRESDSIPRLTFRCPTVR